LSAFIVCGRPSVETSESDDSSVQSIGLQLEPSPSQMSHSSYFDEPLTTPLQSRHERPLPAQMSHTS